MKTEQTMKYRNFEAVADWNYHAHLKSDADFNVVALRRLPAAPSQHDRHHGPADAGSNASTVRPDGSSPVHAPASRPSWLSQFAANYGFAGEALAFGSAFDADPPEAAAPEVKAASPRGSGWLARLGSSIAASYRELRREMAMRRAVQDLRRLDARMLRDIGIVDPTAIEFFVRNGREP
jgi:uncharacterized protein YjiS (DUF1127 family)